MTTVRIDWPRVRLALARASRALFAFFAPVADATFAALSREEVRRAVVKAVVAGGLTAVVQAARTDPTFQSLVVTPLLSAAFTAALDAFRRLGHGADAGPSSLAA